jgi:hypothetical protein
MKTADSVTVSLGPEEALVLFEWLHREDARGAIPTEHKAEQEVLWRIEGQLERVLIRPLQENYAEALSAAREHVVSEKPS